MGKCGPYCSKSDPGTDIYLCGLRYNTKPLGPKCSYLDNGINNSNKHNSRNLGSIK